MTRSRRLTVVLALNLLLVAGLVTVGITAHSLGVLAEGVDSVADATAIGLSLLATWLSGRPSSSRRPHGYPRAAAVAALVNAGWLLTLSLLVVAGASERLIAGGGSVHGLPVLVVSGTTAAVMVVGALILGGDRDEGGDDLHMRAVLLDTIADAAAAAGVAAAGGIILATGGYDWLDPAVGLIIALVVGYLALRLLRDVVAALHRPS